MICAAKDALAHSIVTFRSNLVLTIFFVVLAEVLVFVPFIAHIRADFLIQRIERELIANLSLSANYMISRGLEIELLEILAVSNFVLRRNESREFLRSSDRPLPVSDTYDMRKSRTAVLTLDALTRSISPEPEVIRVIWYPKYQVGT